MELSEVLVYLIKVLAIQGVFYAFYWLVLRDRVSHSLNRVYLLSTLLSAFGIPFVSIPVAVVAQPIIDSQMLVWIAEPMGSAEVQTGGASPASSFPVGPFISWIYFGLVAFLIGRSSLHLLILQKLKKQSECINNSEEGSRGMGLARAVFSSEKYLNTCLPDRQVKPTRWVRKYWFKLFKTTQSRPFSFFSNVFIPDDIFGTKSFDQIVAHECVHVWQLHSVDRLLVDFLVALFWFNPFIYLYRRALIEVHEFQADAAVVKQYDDLIGYQEVLFSQLRSAPYSGLVSHFNFSTIKKRIVMMNKSKSKGQSKLAYFFTVPVVALVLFAFTSKEGENSVNQIADKIEEITAPFESEPVVPVVDQEDRYRPSILPLKSTDKFKVSSMYGRRTDPMSKQVKMHKGMDFSAPIGTSVVATGDGVVHSLKNDPDGYGKVITLNHGSVYATMYAQLSEFKVKKGEKVKKGQLIGLTGNSGKSTGPHLHYEVLENGTRQNPMDFIKNYKFKPVVREIVPPPPPAKNPVEEKKLKELKEVEKNMKVALIADEQRVVAEVAKVRAMEAKVIAEEAAVVAKEARVIAEQQRVLAEAPEVIVVREAAVMAEKRAVELRAQAEKMEREVRVASEAAKKVIKELKAKEEKLKKEKEKNKGKKKKKDK